MSSPSGTNFQRTKMEITVNIPAPEAAVIKAAERVWEMHLSPPNYGITPGLGYEIVKKAVAKHLEEVDLGPIISRYVVARLEEVVDKVVTDLLREKVKAKGRQMIRNGELLSRGDDDAL